MTPIPEPVFDLSAQIAAMLDPSNPKRAVYFSPGNGDAIPSPINPDMIWARPGEGTLLTSDPECARQFHAHGPQDALMAWILGYPQDKGNVVAECQGAPVHLTARSVQARNAAGAVVSEAFVSPMMLDEAQRQMERFVPPGGSLVVLMPVEAIQRRISLREMEGFNG